MNIKKVYKYYDILYDNLTFEEVSRLYREILYSNYQILENKDWKLIRLNQKLRGFIDVYTQMVNGRDFDEEYLMDLIKW